MNMLKKLFLVAVVSLAALVASYFYFFGHQKKELLVINVLSKELYDDLHIAGSVHTSFEDAEEIFKKEWSYYPKNTIFVFYCSNYACGASGEMAKYMRKEGFLRSYAYEGGMAEWFHLHKADKSYKIVGVGNQNYLTLPNEYKKPADEREIITAQDLKKLIEEHKLS